MDTAEQMRKRESWPKYMYTWKSFLGVVCRLVLGFCLLAGDSNPGRGY